MPNLGSGRALGLTLLWSGVLAAVPVYAAQRDDERAAFRRALDAVEHGRDWKKEALVLERYPLLPALEALELARRIDKAKPDEIKPEVVDAFLARWPDTLAADDVRRAWLADRAGLGRWKEFRAAYVPGLGREFVCHEMSARLADGEKLEFARDWAPLWDASTRLPASCDAPLAWSAGNGVIDAQKLWQRIDRAIDAGQGGIADQLVAHLPAGERAAATQIALALRDAPAALKQAGTWPDDTRHRDAVAAAIRRVARRDADTATDAYAKLKSRYKFSEKQKGDIAAAFALYRATEFDADALDRLASVPAVSQTDGTREWRVRVSLAASDWPAALAALDALSDTQKADAEWRYLRARVLVKLDRRADAAPVFATLAREANFYGFLAADWGGEPYTICPLTLAADRDTEKELKNGALGRAFEWRAVDRLRDARREWDWALARMTPERRRLAADLAYREGWFDRAVFALNKGDELKLYEQRFPLAREPQVRRESRASGLDPAWTYAIIRAESAWVEDARSSANALGLMQLLPGTAAPLAKREGIAYRRAEDLFLPDTNIALGTRYLSQMAEKYNGAPWLASAAYNAGPAPVARWLAARGELEPDFFIASIPYRETREYVARVLAFSVIYDWRMNGKALALAARLPRSGQTYAAPGDDTPRKAVVCPAAAAPPPPDVAPAASAAPPQP